MTRFTNRNAVITGGTSGIGLATARRLAAEGGTVLVTGQNPERIATANEIDGVIAIAHDNASADASAKDTAPAMEVGAAPADAAMTTPEDPAQPARDPFATEPETT